MSRIIFKLLLLGLQVVDEDEIGLGGLDIASVADPHINVVKRWGDKRLVRIHPYHPATSFRLSTLVGLGLNEETSLTNTFSLVVSISGLMISLVDHRPQELLVASVDDLSMEAASGVGK